MSNPTILSTGERALLRAILDRIIPADQIFPAAGELDVDAPIERLIAAQPAARRLFLEGLATTEIAAWRLGDADFGDLSAEKQDEVLRDVERIAPTFFDQLVSHAYRHYYVNPKVVQLLGLSAEAPQPNGHILAPFDPALLDQVRARGPIYRKG